MDSKKFLLTGFLYCQICGQPMCGNYCGGNHRYYVHRQKDKKCFKGIRKEHLENAATLVSYRYKRLCEQEPHLPSRYSEVTNLIPLLRNILNTSGVGVAAFRGNRLVGFS